MGKNVISRLDKIQAKKLGITVEEYKEREQTARVIWYKLLCEGKVIDSSLHIPVHKSVAAVETIGCLAWSYLTLLIYNMIGDYGLPTKGIIVLCIFSTILYLIGKSILYFHDMKEFEKYVEKIASWEDTPCKENEEMVDCINRALEFKNHGECICNTPIPFCTIHTKIADDDTKTYELQFRGLSDWNYTKSVPLERMDYNYVVNTMRLELVVFMQEWAKNLVETELLVED